MSSVIRRWVLFGTIQNPDGRLKDSYVGDVGTNKIRLGSKLELLKKQICETCGKKFRKIEELMQHEQVIHGKDSRTSVNSVMFDSLEWNKCVTMQRNTIHTTK